MRTKLAAVALIGSLVSAPALAWGDREQGILGGIAGYWLYQQLTQPKVYGNTNPPQVPPTYPSYGGAMPPPPIIYQPNCRQVLTIQHDRFGNEYRTPITICQ